MAVLIAFDFRVVNVYVNTGDRVFRESRGVSLSSRVRIVPEMLTHVGSHLLARVSGPMKFRLVLQPATAAFFAIRSGLKDARAGKPPYLWSILSDFSHSGPMLKSGWKDIGRVFLLALAMDVVYQLIERHFINPGEAIIVAVVLAIVPYLVLRGLVTRAARREKGEVRTPTQKASRQ